MYQIWQIFCHFILIQRDSIEMTREKAIKIDNILFDMYKLSDDEKNEIGFVEIK